MLFIFFQRNLLCQLIHIAVRNYAHIAAAPRLLQQLLMRALPAAHHRRKKLDLCPLRQLHNQIHHLVNRLLFNLLPALWTMRDTNPRIEQSEIVIDLCDRPDRRTRIAVRRLLVDRDRRRQPFDFLYIRLFRLS